MLSSGQNCGELKEEKDSLLFWVWRDKTGAMGILVKVLEGWIKH